MEGNIVTASAEQLAAVSSDESLAEIQRRTSRTRWLWPYVVASSILVLLLLRASPFVAFLPCTFLALIGGVAISAWDRERTIARLFYDVSDSEIAERIAMCSGVGAWLGRTGALWHVYYAEATSDRKHHAGASTLIRRTLTSCVPRSLDRIQVNLQPWCVPVGPQQLLLLPDRLLVLQAQQRVAGLPYDQLQLHYESSRFIEDRPSTTDAEFIEWTWQYVNKSGGPDRRFRDNRQLPVYRYGELHLVSQSGVHIVLQCSSRACAEGAAHALEALIDRARQSLRAPSYRQQ